MRLVESSTTRTTIITIRTQTKDRGEINIQIGFIEQIGVSKVHRQIGQTKQKLLIRLETLRQGSIKHISMKETLKEILS